MKSVHAIVVTSLAGLIARCPLGIASANLAFILVPAATVKALLSLTLSTISRIYLCPPLPPLVL